MVFIDVKVDNPVQLKKAYNLYYVKLYLFRLCVIHHILRLSVAKILEIPFVFAPVFFNLNEQV